MKSGLTIAFIFASILGIIVGVWEGVVDGSNGLGSIKFESSFVDLGVIGSGDTADLNVVLVNQSNKKIALPFPKSSCGCATPRIQDESILVKAHDREVIGFKVDTLGRVGRIGGRIVTLAGKAGERLDCEWIAYVLPTWGFHVVHDFSNNFVVGERIVTKEIRIVGRKSTLSEIKFEVGGDLEFVAAGSIMNSSFHPQLSERLYRVRLVSDIEFRGGRGHFSFLNGDELIEGMDLKWSYVPKEGVLNRYSWWLGPSEVGEPKIRDFLFTLGEEGGASEAFKVETSPEIDCKILSKVRSADGAYIFEVQIIPRESGLSKGEIVISDSKLNVLAIEWAGSFE